MKEAGGVSYHFACKKDIAAYQRIRPIPRLGNVDHILPQPDGRHWDGPRHVDPVVGRGVAFVFRPGSPDSGRMFSPKGLDPRADYRVSFEDTPETYTRAGRSRMENGLRVSLAEGFPSALVYLERK